MVSSLTRIADATVEPVTLDEAKLHMRVTHADEDALISALITSARRWVEQFTWRALLDQTWKLILDEFPPAHRGPHTVTDHHLISHHSRSGEIHLPRPPLLSVTSITYHKKDGTTETVDASTYIVDTAHEPGRIALADGESWPPDTLQTIAGVEVEYKAGYGTGADDVPRDMRQAVLMLAGHLYEHRETVVVGGGGNDREMPFASRTLAWPYRSFAEV